MRVVAYPKGKKIELEFTKAPNMLGSRIDLVNLEELEETGFLIMLRTDFGVEGSKPNSNSKPPKWIGRSSKALVRPFGLCNALSTCTTLMITVFH